MAKSAKRNVRRSLLEQLKLQNKTPEFYSSLVDDYMGLWDLKEKQLKDIEERGLRYSVTNGNGITTEKPNESVQNLPKTTSTMLKILNDLNLKEPLIENSDEDDYL